MTMNLDQVLETIVDAYRSRCCYPTEYTHPIRESYSVGNETIATDAGDILLPEQHEGCNTAGVNERRQGRHNSFARSSLM